MQGFDPKFKDFPDYILGITKEIWEDRGIDTLHHYYSDDIVVRSPNSVVLGNRNVIGATMATLAEFPDRQLLGEDVIWSGTPEEGMLSSHRIISMATHAYGGMYGEATGKKLQYRILADCHAINNQINDEWLIRDQGAIVRQMGWDPKQYAIDLIEREGGAEACVKPLSPKTIWSVHTKAKATTTLGVKKYADMIGGMMGADMAVVTRDYDRAVQAEHPGGITGHGWASIDQFWMNLRAAFPSAEFKVDHVIGRDDPTMPPRAAVRWSLWGKHDGWGAFGKPTGAEVYVLGISHAEFGPWGLRREYTLFDETSVWKQIALATG